MKIMLWLQANYIWIVSIVEAIVVFLITRSYYKAVYKNKLLEYEQKIIKDQISEENRINELTHDFENKLDEDKPVEDTPCDFPKKVILAIMLFFFFSCSTKTIIIKPELPRLKLYYPQHREVVYELKEEKYCIEKEKIKDVFYNDAEYKRVINSYEKQINLYNEYLIQYYNPKTHN